jgi:hypothetical protein
MYQEGENASKSKTRLYNIWKMMRKRCRCKSRSDYKYYGGRGIKVCEEWNRSDGYDSFRKWALENGYKDGLTIDRIDVDKDYSPDNCRWATMLEQSYNRRNSKTKEVPPEPKYKKYQKAKQSEQNENKKQTKLKSNKLTYKGKTQTIGDWSRETGLDRHVIRKRILLGWNVKRILETPVDMSYSIKRKGKKKAG